MRRVAQQILLSVLCLLGIEQGQAQPVVCWGDNSCIADGSAVALAATTLASLAGHEFCPEASVDITAASPDERRIACLAASEAIQLLGRCGISLRRPLHLQIMSEVRHPFSGSIFGLLDTKHEKVLITHEANIPALVKDTPYATLPQREFYRSVIVHEVVHAVMHQNLKRPATTHAAYEYPAYALQIESLAPQLRDTFLQSFDQAAIKANSTVFTDTILSFDPYFFAARAYHHFKGSANGCAHLAALLEGAVTFIAAPQM
jgi:Family of unknown function (DUF6639)